jgi:hypothetical protein
MSPRSTTYSPSSAAPSYNAPANKLDSQASCAQLGAEQLECCNTEKSRR